MYCTTVFVNEQLLYCIILYCNVTSTCTIIATTTKDNKLMTMTKNVINNGKITTRVNITIIRDKSTNIQFYGQWR